MYLKKKSARIIYYFLPFCLIFCLLFNFKVRVIPFLTSNKVLAILGMFNFFFMGKTKTITKKLYNYLQFYCLILSITLIVLIINISPDISLFFYFTYNFIICFFAAFFVVTVLKKKKIALISLMKLIAYVNLFQILIVIMTILSPGFKNFLMSFQSFGDVDVRIKALLGTRNFGLGFGFDYGTGEITLASLCCLYLFLTERKKYWRWFFIAILISAVSVTVGRTMFVGIMIQGLFFLFCPTFFKIRKRKVIISSLILGGLGLSIVILFVDFTVFTGTLAWVFSELIQLIVNGKITHGSLYILFGDMLFYPGDKTFFLGDGFYLYEGKQYMHTDFGWLRLILYGGIGFALAFLTFIIESRKLIFVNKSNSLRVLANIFVFFQLVFLIKIMHLFLPFFLLFILYSQVNENENII